MSLRVDLFRVDADRSAKCRDIGKSATHFERIFTSEYASNPESFVSSNLFWSCDSDERRDRRQAVAVHDEKHVIAGRGDASVGRRLDGEARRRAREERDFDVALAGIGVVRDARGADQRDGVDHCFHTFVTL
jgi:hypothetical protein